MTAGSPLDPDLDPLHPLTVGLVFLGGTAGGLARYAVTRAWPAPVDGFPWATLVVNLSGALSLAVLLVVLARRWPDLNWARPLLGTGALGAWTTFSAISVSTDHLLARGRIGLAAGYLAASLVGGVAAAAAGMAAVGRLTGPAPDVSC